MGSYRVLIAESSEDFRRALGQRLEKICSLSFSCTGKGTLEQIVSRSPEVLVLDLMLPGMDGISLLEALQASGRRPAIVATTTYISPYLLGVLEPLGVRALLQRPCDPETAAHQVITLLQRAAEPEELRSRISGILLKLGFPAKLRGYAYLREAVYQMTLDPDRSMVKELYAEVGAKFSVSALQVEHSIRGAIRVAWEHRDPTAWALWLGEGRGIRPTSAAFIQALARCLEQTAEIRREERLHRIG